MERLIKFKKLYILCCGGVCLLDRDVLVLNQNYEPLSVCSAKRAIILVFLGKAEIIEHHDLSVRSISRSFPLPSVVRLILYIQIPRKGVILSRRNVIKRDGHRCQYCSTTQGAMTVDHVIPKTLGGKDSWDNLVCACIGCNNKKGNRTPEQAHLQLIRQPRVPNRITFIQHFIGIADARWRPYLFLS
ncbi:MAG: HNH endonuclease [Gemmatimonadota bacterium]|nr:MAG: HNH endonuclease [Gemmatimonadota bacterium]